MARQEAKRKYQALTAAGKTDEAKADLARLAIIRQQREDAAKKRELEQKGVCDCEQLIVYNYGELVQVFYCPWLLLVNKVLREIWAISTCLLQVYVHTRANFWSTDWRSFDWLTIIGNSADQSPVLDHENRPSAHLSIVLCAH